MNGFNNLKNSLKGKGLRRLSNDTFWTILSQVSITLMNIGIIFFLANLLTPHDLGQYKLISTWLAVAISLGFTGYIYTLPQKFAKKESVNLKYLIRKTLIKSSHVFGVLIMICIYYFYNQNLELAISFLLMSALAPITLLYMLANTYYIGTKKFKLSSLSLNLVQVFQFTSIVSTAYLTEDFLYTAMAFLTSTIIANTASILYVLHKIKEYRAEHEVSADESKLEEAGANKLNFSSIISGLAYQSDKLLLFHFVGAAQLAIYSIALAISDQARTPFKIIASIFLPRMSENNSSKKNAYKLFAFMTFLSVSTSILIIIINPYVFKYIFPKYLEFVNLANAAATILIFSSASILITFLQSKKQFDVINSNQILMTILMLVLYPIAAFYQSVILFIIIRNFVAGVCFGYILYKVIRLK